MTADLFAVCPHDTARGFEKWAMLNTFVNKHLALHAKFQLYLDFTEFGADLERQRFLWAYLNPADFLKASTRFGYGAVARPIGRFDVAYVIGPASGGAATSLAAVAGKRLAAVKGYLFLLVSRRLQTEGIHYELVPAKSYAEVMSHVERGEADFGVTYNEHFDVLTHATREKFSLVDAVHGGVSHVFAVHPSVASGMQRELTELLVGAPEREDGRKVLHELQMSGFERVPEGPFRALQAITESAAA